uniref:DNA-directed DNA/RNA polymerase mu n=1 Tax=Amphiprion ocellaris TaxID=80972 RepID=A0AAQ6A2I0_AMPOC
MVPLKRRKVVSSDTGSTGSDCSGDQAPTKFPQVVLFLLERKMGASRRAFLSQLGRTKGFHLQELFSESVTHVISENNSADEVRTWLDSQTRGESPTAVHLLDISWYTESMRAGRPVEILDRHKLQEQQINEAEVVLFSVPSYACQRRTTLDNHNVTLTDALSLLAENAELSDEDGRGVAFRRAAAVLKALPAPVTAMSQLTGLPCLGDHSLRVIKDILENEASDEVESTKQSDRFKALKVLTGIFGVGSKTADRWIRDGIHNLHQLQESGATLNRAQQAGLEHYNDLNQQVTKAEADAITEIVQEAVVSVLPGAQGFLLYQKTTRNSYLEVKDGPGRPSSNMDRFERCLSIFKLAKKEERGIKVTVNTVKTRDSVRDHTQSETDQNPQSHSYERYELTNPPAHRQWRAVRVDLVVSPISQFAFALLGWTGSKLFERELRRWAGHEKAMSLSSHALYDNKQSRYLRAASEEEIFAHLGLEYIPPSERNA